MSEKARKVFKALLAVLAYVLTVLLLTGSAKADVFSGLEAYYPFDGNASDTTGNGHNGTVYGAVLTEDRFNQSDRAYSFDGDNDYIDIGDFDTILEYDKNWTISFWVYVDNETMSTDIFSGSDGGSGSIQFIIRTNYVKISNSADSSADWKINYYIDYNEWVFYTLVWHSSGKLEVYINGDKVGEDTSGTLADFYPNHYPVLMALNGVGGVSNFAKGKLDEVRIYNRALNEEEVQELYTFFYYSGSYVMDRYEDHNASIYFLLTFNSSVYEHNSSVNISYNNSPYEPMTFLDENVTGSMVTKQYVWVTPKLPFPGIDMDINYSIKYVLVNKSSLTEKVFENNYFIRVLPGYTPLNVSLNSDVVEQKNETYTINVRATGDKTITVLLEKDNGTETNYTASLSSVQGIIKTYKVVIPTDSVEANQYVTESFKPYVVVQHEGTNYSRTIDGVSQRIHNFSMALTTSSCPSGNSYAKYFEALNVDIDLEENPSSTVATSSVVENHFYLTPQDGTEFYFSPSIDTNTNSYKVCIYPDFVNLTVSDWSDIYYYSNLNNSDETFKRYYWFSPGCTKLSNDSVKTVQLYAFGDADLPYPDDYLTVSIQVKDSQGSAVQDAIVKVLKRFPDGTYKTVEVTKTNTDGTAVAKVVAYRALYKFIVEKDCEALFESQPLQISQSTLTITLPTGTATNPFFDYYQFLLTLYFNLNYTDTEWKLTFTDTSNVVKTHCLQVFEKSFPSWVKKNEQCVTSTAGTITLDRDSSKTQQAVYTVNGIPIALLTSEEANPARQTFKNVGGGFIPIILTMLAMGVSMMIASPSAFFFIEPLILLISHKLGWIAATSATLYGFAILLVVIGVLLSVKKT